MKETQRGCGDEVGEVCGVSIRRISIDTEDEQRVTRRGGTSIRDWAHREAEKRICIRSSHFLSVAILGTPLACVIRGFGISDAGWTDGFLPR